MGVGGRGSQHASSDRSLGGHAERDVCTSIGQAHRPKPWSSAVKAAASGCSPRKGALGKGCLLPKLHLCLQWAWCPCVVQNLHNWTRTLPERHWARTLEETHSCPLPPRPHQGLCLSLGTEYKGTSWGSWTGTRGRQGAQGLGTDLLNHVCMSGAKVRGLMTAAHNGYRKTGAVPPEPPPNGKPFAWPGLELQQREACRGRAQPSPADLTHTALPADARHLRPRSS